MSQNQAGALADASAFFVGERPRSFVSTLIGIGLLTIALAQPRWGVERRSVSAPPKTLWLVFDLSRTMACRDMPGSRLEFSKSVALALTSGSFERIRASSADGELLIPATSDLTRARQAVESLEVGSATTQGSFPFDEPHVGVWFSDGNRESPAPPVGKGNWIVVGLGDSKLASPIPNPDGGWMTERGSLSESKRNDSQLQTMAKELGGRVLPAWPDVEAVSRAIAQATIGDVATAGSQFAPSERFQWFAAAGLLFLLRPWIWIRRPIATVGMFALLLVGSPAEAQSGVHPYTEARLYLETGRWSNARAAFKLLYAREESPMFAWGEAVALTEMAKEDQSREARSERLAEAIRRFRAAEKDVESPLDREAVRRNIAIVKRLITDSNTLPTSKRNSDPGKSNGTSNDKDGPGEGVASKAPPKVGTEIGGGGVETPVAGLKSADPGRIERKAAEAIIDSLAARLKPIRRRANASAPKFNAKE